MRTPEKINPISKISLTQIVNIPGYEPNPEKGKRYVIGVDKLITNTVVGYEDRKGIRSLICIARVTNPQIEMVTGQYVILIDKKLVKMLKNPFTRKQAMALIEVQNAMSLPYPNSDVTLHNNLDGANADTVYGDQVSAMLTAAKRVGYKPTACGIRKQQEMVLCSSKPVASRLHRDYKRTLREEKRAEREAEAAADPFCDALA